MQHHFSRQEFDYVPPMPGYPSFLTLLALYIFVQEKMDVVIMETGIGGENDSTNIITRPSATGITALGIDHVNVLGNNISSIAWHKAGIFKQDSPAFTVDQDEPALEVLRRRSSEKGVAGELLIVDEEVVDRFGLVIDPDMSFQRRNASLAIVLAETYLKQLEPTFTMTQALARSLERTILPGRCEIIPRFNNIWFLSVAHNEMSMEQTSHWFRRNVERPG